MKDIHLFVLDRAIMPQDLLCRTWVEAVFDDVAYASRGIAPQS